MCVLRLWFKVHRKQKVVTGEETINLCTSLCLGKNENYFDISSPRSYTEKNERDEKWGKREKAGETK